MSVPLYGAPIWADAINAREYRRTEMVSVKWKTALRCVSACRTAPIEAVCVLAGIPDRDSHGWAQEGIQSMHTTMLFSYISYALFTKMSSPTTSWDAQWYATHLRVTFSVFVILALSSIGSSSLHLFFFASAHSHQPSHIDTLFRKQCCHCHRRRTLLLKDKFFGWARHSTDWLAT